MSKTPACARSYEAVECALLLPAVSTDLKSRIVAAQTRSARCSLGVVVCNVGGRITVSVHSTATCQSIGSCRGDMP